ncbi:hypothetical protein L6Q21_08080 [Sandaracinobacter sp. RS1-74]|uniref:hypothetical protein n=1 Tax=Sandaracinobacteroides sayramensis TaxID=2913411 RepID=UPI001EDAF018|nr:hypothetical protein [Sandaracinobacteroides sayramensis]MCG2840937.1 hypothetical protein [Sandaracinobacteroides sayramensis]
MLTPLDETLHHQAPLTFDHVHTTDHRFYDRQLMGGFRADGEIAFLAGITMFKNMNVLEGFAMVQAKSSRQYNVRMTRQLRPMPDSDARIGPLSLTIAEAFHDLSYILAAGDYPISFEMNFRAAAPPRLEHPHVSRGDGRLHTNYLRYNQLGRISGHIVADTDCYEAQDWFGWRDHSWGVRPGVGGFEPMTGTAGGGGVASASRTGGKGLFLVHAGFQVGGASGAVQLIEDGEGKRIYTEGEVRDGAGDPVEVTGIDHDVKFKPGTRVFDRIRLDLALANGHSVPLEAQAVGRPWVYRGGGFDGGFNDGQGQGVWRSRDLAFEIDSYDISDPEKVVMPDGSIATPRHREQLAVCAINGETGSAYMPMFVIGPQPRFGF